MKYFTCIQISEQYQCVGKEKSIMTKPPAVSAVLNIEPTLKADRKLSKERV